MNNIEVKLAFSEEGIDTVIKDVSNLKKELQAIQTGANSSSASVGQSMNVASSSVKGFGAAVGLAAGALASIEFGALALKAIEASEKLTQLQNTLKRVSSGDADIAAQKFRELTGIANELGLKNNELVETYSKLALRGFKPTGDEMKKLIDIAKASNKSVDQLAEAILDLSSGEAERIKEFGIKTKISGDSISLTFNGVTKTVKNSADEINKAVLSFGDLVSIQGAAAQSANGLEAAQNRLSNATDALLANIGKLGSGIASGFVNGFASIVTSINNTISPQQALNDSFAATYESVLNTQKVVPQLTKRYDELKGKTSLTKAEQGELNGLIEQLSSLYPQAVGELDKYGKALDINTSIIKSNNAEQRANLLQLTKLQIADLEAKVKQLDVTKKQQDIDRKNGFTTTQQISGTAGYTVALKTQLNATKALRDEQKSLTDIIATKADLENKQKLLKQLEGTGEVTDFRKKEAEKAKVASKATKEEEDAAKKAKKKREDDLKALQRLIEKAADDAAKQGAKIGNTNEEIVLKQKNLALSQIKDQEDEIIKLAKQLGKKVDVTKEFGELRLVVEEEYISKIRAARQKDLETAFGIEAVLNPLENSIKNIDFTKFQTNESKSLATALLDPKEFERQFKAINDSAKLGSDELSSIVSNMVRDINGQTATGGTFLDKFKKQMLDTLGIDDEQLNQIVGQFSELTGNIFNFFKAQNEAAVKANEDLVKQYDERISIQEKSLETELQRQKDGSANSVDAEKEKLGTLQKERDAAEAKAQESRQKALNLQLLQEGISQVSSLITTGANIMQNFSKVPFVGVVLGIAAVASMLLAFKSFKTQAQGATKLRQGKRFEGKSHEDGGIPFGSNYEVEGGEWLIGTRHSNEHNNFLKRLNSGEFQGVDLNKFVSSNNPIFSAAARMGKSNESVEQLRKMEMKSVFSEVMKEHLNGLIEHDKKKPSFIAMQNGYIEIRTNPTGGKSVKSVKLG